MGAIVLDAERYAELINELEELRKQKSMICYEIDCLIKNYDLDYFNILANIEDRRYANDGEFIVSKIKEIINQIIKKQNNGSLEKLKTLANEKGYNLTKKQKYVPLAKCSCGAKLSVKCYHTFYGQYYQCVKCGLKSEEGCSNRVAREHWNEKVEQSTKENNNDK